MAASHSTTRIESLCGVILSAGQSSRMGTQKPLLPWPPASVSGGTLLSAVIASLAPYAETVLVVVGENAELLSPVINASGALAVVNPHPERGQFSSMRIGLGELTNHGFTAAMICPVDGPPLSDASLHMLAAAFRKTPGTHLWGVAPRNGEKRGHPLLANRELIDAFLTSPAESNAKEVKRVHEERIEYVDLDDPYVGINVNTPEEYAELCRTALARD